MLHRGLILGAGAFLALGAGLAYSAPVTAVPAPADASQGAVRGDVLIIDPKANYPDSYNTGSSGTKTVIDQNVVLTQPGAVLRNVEIHGTLTIAATATGAVVDNVSVSWPVGRPTGGAFAMIDSRAANVRISNCDVAANGVIQSGLFLATGPVTVDGCEITGAGDGAQIGADVTIVNSFFHSMSVGPRKDWHVDTIQIVGSKNVVLRHNTIINEQPQTAAVGIWSDVGPVSNVIVQDNLIGGGGFTVYCTKTSYSLTGVQFLSNRFTSAVYPRVGYWNTVSGGNDGIVYPTAIPSDLVWTGNVYHESGAPVPLR